MIVTAVIDVITNASGSALMAMIGGLVSLALVIPSLAVGARRLHDIGRSGWWQLLSLTFIGVFVLIYWWVQPTAPSANIYASLPA
jgi:uncharacterized membrane protein YhaH (DUF805 family)